MNLEDIMLGEVRRKGTKKETRWDIKKHSKGAKRPMVTDPESQSIELSFPRRCGRG